MQDPPHWPRGDHSTTRPRTCEERCRLDGAWPSPSTVSADPPPRRFIAGADVIALAQRKIQQLEDDIESHRELSESLTFDE